MKMELAVKKTNFYAKLMFIYSEEVTIFCKIFTLLLSYVVPVKSKVKISQNFVAFSKYMSFNSCNYFQEPPKVVVKGQCKVTEHMSLY